MLEKLQFWKGIQNNKKKQVMFLVISIIILLFIYIPTVQKIRRIREQDILENLQVTTDLNLLFDMYDVEILKEDIKFSGWALHLNAKNLKLNLILRAVDGSDIEIVTTDMHERTDVVEYINPSWDFGNCGFTTSIKKKELDATVCYEVQLVLYYEQERETQTNNEVVEFYKKISTNYYLYNDQLYSYNPEQFIEPAILDEELRQIIQEGTLKVFDLENLFWVYRYGNDIYCITNSSFGSMKEAKIGIPVMPYTSRPELLPEQRIQYGFDHLGFFYENEEYKRDSVLPYQVVKVTFSEEYPTTYVTMGLYNAETEEWIKRFFALMIDF